MGDAKNLTLKRKRWGIPVEEFHKGWLSEPVPVSEFDRRNAFLSLSLSLSLRVSALRNNAVNRNRSSAC